MALQNLDTVLSTMDEMIDLELALTTLYTACGEAFPEDEDLWLNLTLQERQHAEFIAQLKTLVSANSREFDLGRSFNSTAIKTIKSGIADHIDHLRKGQLSRDRALFICRDIENSVLETNYRDFVKSNNLEFRGIIETIAEQTLTHKNALAERIAKAKSSRPTA